MMESIERTEQKTRRLFIAIRVPDAFASELAEFGQQHAGSSPGMRFTGAADLHVTLKFLGAVRPAAIKGLRMSLGEVSGPRFGVSLAEADFFERAGVLVMGVERADALAKLQEQVEQATEKLGFAREERAYRPHITIARRRGHKRAGANERRTQRELIGKLNSYCKELAAPSFLVANYALYESAGGHYRVLEEYVLGR